MRTRPSRRAGEGFTLVEVLVALFIMAVLATLAWQGLDGIVRARDGSRVVIERSARLATVMTQWQQDLEAIYDTEGVVPALAFDGQTLRLTRRTDAGVQLVAWAVRGGVWQRWAGPIVTRAADLAEGWLRSQQLLGNEPGQLTVAEGASQWQVFFNRGGNWSNAQSSGDLLQVSPPPAPEVPGSGSTPGTPPPPSQPPRVQLPGGVRMVITLDGQTLTRDIALGATG